MEQKETLREFEEMKPLLAQAKVSTFFVIPLKYESGALQKEKVRTVGKPWAVTTMDLSEPVKALFREDGTAAAVDVGGHWMTITGTTEDGRYIVSSWGGRYFLNPSELNNPSFFIMDIYV